MRCRWPAGRRRLRPGGEDFGGDGSCSASHRGAYPITSLDALAVVHYGKPVPAMPCQGSCANRSGFAGTNTRGGEMADTHTGTCFCGAIAIEVTGAPDEMGYCHCSSCRAYSGAPVKAFTLWKKQNVKVTKGAELLGRFQKTQMSVRRFCMTCGGHVMVDHPGLGLTDVYAAMLPSLAFKPTVHLNYAETVLPMKDGLPKLKDFPTHAGGSGGVIPE